MTPRNTIMGKRPIIGERVVQGFPGYRIECLREDGWFVSYEPEGEEHVCTISEQRGIPEVDPEAGWRIGTMQFIKT